MSAAAGRRDLDKCTLGHPGKYTYCVAENEARQPVRPLSCRAGLPAGGLHRLRDRRRGAAQRHRPSVQRPRGHSRHDVLGDEHHRLQQRRAGRALRGGARARSTPATIAKHGWTRHDIRNYLWMHAGNRFDAISRDHRYGKVYNRNLPKWYKREPDSRIPIVPSPDHIHLFVIGGACRPVLRLHSRLGPHEHAGAASHRRRRRPDGAGLRRRRLRTLRRRRLAC